jgi:prepilin-type N-terminal cleavage/methylation domain-containing protein
MEHASRRISFDRGHDDGMTLIEVLAAVIVIVIVALSGAGLSINGIQTAAAQEREQVAVTIANGAMENVSGKAVSNLIAGRCASEVNAAFTAAANATKPGVSDTYRAWDTSAPAVCACQTSVGVPVVQSPTGSGPCNFPAQNNTDYTVTTLIGTCYELVQPAASATRSCSTIPGDSSTQAAAAAVGVGASYAALERVIVIVSWTAGSHCSVTACYYETTTLADPPGDLTWYPAS